MATKQKTNIWHLGVNATSIVSVPKSRYFRAFLSNSVGIDLTVFPFLICSVCNSFMPSTPWFLVACKKFCMLCFFPAAASFCSPVVKAKRKRATAVEKVYLWKQSHYLTTFCNCSLKQNFRGCDFCASEDIFEKLYSKSSVANGFFFYSFFLLRANSCCTWF